jgi:hypothetical protein
MLNGKISPLVPVPKPPYTLMTLNLDFTHSANTGPFVTYLRKLRLLLSRIQNLISCKLPVLLLSTRMYGHSMHTTLSGSTTFFALFND